MSPLITLPPKHGRVDWVGVWGRVETRGGQAGKLFDRPEKVRTKRTKLKSKLNIVVEDRDENFSCV
jgi:hypothetical protein